MDNINYINSLEQIFKDVETSNNNLISALKTSNVNGKITEIEKKYVMAILRDIDIIGTKDRIDELSSLINNQEITENEKLNHINNFFINKQKSEKVINMFTPYMLYMSVLNNMQTNT